MRKTFTGLFLAVCLSSALAFGDEAPAAAEPSAASKSMSPSFYIAGGFQDSPNASVFAFFPNGFAIGVFASMKYDGNLADKKISSNIALWATYLLFNKLAMKIPVFSGPEIIWGTSLAGPGDAFAFQLIQPGWAVWFYPFPVPVALGVVESIQIVLPKGGSAQISLATPALRVAIPL